MVVAMASDERLDVLRKRLRRLAGRIEDAVGPFGYRVFVDSAPVLEKALAEKAGLGWIGKHTNLLNRESGSWFFLGEILDDRSDILNTGQTESDGNNYIKRPFRHSQCRHHMAHIHGVHQILIRKPCHNPHYNSADD